MELQIIFVFCAVLSVAATPTGTKKYRDDYVYNERTDAFYKLHIESDFVGDPRWLRATCEVEGADLMTAVTEADIYQVHELMKNYPDIDYVYIGVGSESQSQDSTEQQPTIEMSSESGSEHESTIEVITSDGLVETIEGRILPFVCKVQAKDVPPYNQRCGVHARGYRYYSSVNSCYRIPPIVYTWYEAYDESQAEGAHLAIVNSDMERVVLQNLTSLDGNIPNTWRRSYFFIGFRAEQTAANTPRVFKTIFNQTLEEAGFSEWSWTEPNNLGGRENCGSLYENDGKLNDNPCTVLCPFICEKEVGASTGS